MSKNKVELIIENNDGVRISVDILDFPYRLNRNVFTTSDDKLKTLGGTFSTKIVLGKSKKNNRFFKTSEFKSINKFNKNVDYNAVMLQDGAEVIRGLFKLERITSQGYEGTFLDQDIDWLDRLNKVSLNKLGYVDGNPTWLVPFDGAIDFNIVNEQTNKQTDFICPTIVYNNTPTTDYLDFTDDDIWGTVDISGKSFPNDFITTTGLFDSRYGLTFQDFPPALYYRNVIEKIFDEIDLSIDCSLFNEEWFNVLYMPYVGDGYKYNWKNLATIYSETLYTVQTDESNFDDVITVSKADDDVDLNNADLPLLGGGVGTNGWIQNESFRFRKADVIKHDNPGGVGFTDKITSFNAYGLEGQYICPADGNYTLKVNAHFYNENTTKIDLYDGPAIWLGESLFNAFGTWDVNSNTGTFLNNHYGWDDCVLIIRRYSASGDEVYSNTDEMLYQWMNGQNTDFIENPSDVIAYLSPKREYINRVVTPIAENQWKGSPITNFETDVTTSNVDFDIISTSAPKISAAKGYIEIDIDLRKNERIVMYWTSLTNIRGEVTLDPSAPPAPLSDAYDSTAQTQSFGTNAWVTGINDFDITYNCGEYDLNLAENLPNISGKDFIASFIKQFNLHFTKDGGTVRFLPQRNYYTPEVYDITSRVMNNDWTSDPILTQKFLNIGYNNDNNDRLLNGIISSCDTDSIVAGDYANVSFENENVYGTAITNDFNLFSATLFVDGILNTTSYITCRLDTPTSIDPVSGVEIIKGADWNDITFREIQRTIKIPSIQSQSSFDQKTVGDLTYDFNYSPRLLYHCGTIRVFDPTPTGELFQCLIDSPRLTDVTSGVLDVNDFIRKPKHWYWPTISQFDTENQVISGKSYPTLRYDTVGGIYNSYFENTIDAYNGSEMLTLKMAMNQKDWINMRGSKKIRYKDQLYKLMAIKDYDPLTNNIATVKLLKEI